MHFHERLMHVSPERDSTHAAAIEPTAAAGYQTLSFFSEVGKYLRCRRLERSSDRVEA
jgi:hypothetical protein